jgi:lipid-A-disaccharide synthase
LKLAMVAGEASGDQLGGQLLPALRKTGSPLDASGIGGPCMHREGFSSLFAMESLSVMGPLQPLARLPRLLSMRRSLTGHWRSSRPDLLVGVDAPDFNLTLERDLRREGIPTVHLVSPSVWAWRSYRTGKIASAADLLLTLFPFEEQYYQGTGVHAEYVGHPLADEYPLQGADTHAARERLQLAGSGPVLALLPGSRAGELRRHAALFLQVAQRVGRRLLQRQGKLQCIIPAANPRCLRQLQLLAGQFPELDIRLLDGEAGVAIAASDAVLVASGTATLQTLLLKKPMVIAYRLGAASHALLAPMLKVPWIGLPNLLAGRELVPEFVQHRASVELLSQALEPMLANPEISRDLFGQYTRLHRQLRRGFAARSGQAIDRLLEGRC